MTRPVPLVTCNACALGEGYWIGAACRPLLHSTLDWAYWAARLWWAAHVSHALLSPSRPLLYCGHLKPWNGSLARPLNTGSEGSKTAISYNVIEPAQPAIELYALSGPN